MSPEVVTVTAHHTYRVCGKQIRETGLVWWTTFLVFSHPFAENKWFPSYMITVIELRKIKKSCETSITQYVPVEYWVCMDCVVENIIPQWNHCFRQSWSLKMLRTKTWDSSGRSTTFYFSWTETSGIVSSSDNKIKGLIKLKFTVSKMWIIWMSLI
jgi:hypothetical protein